MPARGKCLFLQEELMLLALRDTEGTVAADSMYQYALGGAILAELLLGKRIAIDDRKSDCDESGLGAWLRQALSEKNLVDTVSEESLDDPLLDECLERILSARRRASLKTWLQRFARIGGLRHHIATGLCRKNVLRADEDRVLLIFKRRIYPELDPRPEDELIDRLRTAIFTDAPTVDTRTTILISLADSAELLKIPFAKKELRARQARIKQITQGEMLGEATRETIQAARTAMMCAAFVPVMVCAAHH